jgi:hypothetical protein
MHAAPLFFRCLRGTEVPCAREPRDGIAAVLNADGGTSRVARTAGRRGVLAGRVGRDAMGREEAFCPLTKQGGFFMPLAVGTIVRITAGPLAGLRGPIIGSERFRWIVKPDAFPEGAFVCISGELLAPLPAAEQVNFRVPSNSRMLQRG